MIMFLVSTPLQAAPPDLTGTGVIAGIDRSETYNLGATGMRGWFYVSRGGTDYGTNGTMTGESRQILVTVASTPASAVIQVNDVILGAMAGNAGTVSYFSSDSRKALGVAIGAAEKTGAGTLRVKRWRAGTTTDVYSSNLVDWTTAVDDGISPNIMIADSNDFYGAGVDMVEVKIKRTLAVSGKIFSRLKVVIAP